MEASLRYREVASSVGNRKIALWVAVEGRFGGVELEIIIDMVVGRVVFAKLYSWEF